jgi:chromosome segregation ATPase
MHTAPSEGSGRYADLTLSVYLEEMARDRRVLWVGTPSSGAPERIAHNARAVLALDPTGRASRGRFGRLRVSTLRSGPLSFQRGSFDLAVVSNVADLDRDELGARMDELQDAVGADGVLVVATAHGQDVGDLGYEAFYELLADRFPVVRMVGQAPFYGYAVADLEPEDREEVLVDGTLAAGAHEDEQAQQPVERFVAVCAHHPAHVAAYAVLQVPAEAWSEARPAWAAPSAQPTQREGSREQAQLEQQLEQQRQQTEQATEQAGELQRRLEEQEERAQQAHEHAEELERTLHERQQELSRLQAELEETRDALDQAREQGSEQASRELEQEYARLESALEERAQEVLDLRGEVERRGTLVRDLVEELRELRAGNETSPSCGEGGQTAGGAGPSLDAGPQADALRAERDAAVERALDAEARLAETRFRADELEAQLTGGAAAEPAGTDEATARAELTGAVRGLRSRCAELEEMRELAEGRLGVAEAELQQARERERELERQLGELHERFEFELVQARGEPSGGHDETERVAELQASERQLTEQVGQLRGQLVACREQAEQLEQQRDRARAETLRLTAQVRSTENRLAGMVRGYEHRVAELRAELGAAPARSDADGEMAALEQELLSIRGQRDGLSARLQDRERALQVQRDRPTPEVASGASQEELQAVRAERDRAQAEAERAGKRVQELETAMQAREDLVTRLQMEVASHEDSQQDLQHRLDRLRADNERMRSGLHDASDAVDRAQHAEQRAQGLEERIQELEQQLAEERQRASGESSEAEQLRAQVAQLQRERDDSQSVLREVRQMLAELRLPSRQGESGEGREITAVGVDAPESGDELQKLRDELQQARAAQREKDELERQLGERDERIAALQRRLQAEGPPEQYNEELKREMMEMQERVARLTEELEHERAARRAAEDASAGNGGNGASSGASEEREAELQRMQQAIAERDARMEEMRDKASRYERDFNALRQACVDARNGLEELLGTATASGDPSTAERIGSLLRLLSRF